MPSTVKQLKREAKERAEEKVRIYNPDSEDFKIFYAGEKHTIRSREIAEFPRHIAEHIKKHLANHILHKNYPSDKNAELALKKIYKEIEVEL